MNSDLQMNPCATIGRARCRRRMEYSLAAELVSIHQSRTAPHKWGGPLSTCPKSSVTKQQQLLLLQFQCHTCHHHNMIDKTCATNTKSVVFIFVNECDSLQCVGENHYLKKIQYGRLWYAL